MCEPIMENRPCASGRDHGSGSGLAFCSRSFLLPPPVLGGLLAILVCLPFLPSTICCTCGSPLSACCSLCLRSCACFPRARALAAATCDACAASSSFQAPGESLPRSREPPTVGALTGEESHFAAVGECMSSRSVPVNCVEAGPEGLPPLARLSRTIRWPCISTGSCS